MRPRSAERRAPACARRRSRCGARARRSTPSAAGSGSTGARPAKLVQKEVRLLAGESDTEERRLLHAEALMDLWRVLYGPATAGDIDAIDRFLRVEERIASLLGLDRPSGRREQRRGQDRARPLRRRARGGAQAPLHRDGAGARAAAGLAGGGDPRPPAAQEAVRVRRPSGSRARVTRKAPPPIENSRRAEPPAWVARARAPPAPAPQGSGPGRGRWPHRARSGRGRAARPCGRSAPPGERRSGS